MKCVRYVVHTTYGTDNPAMRNRFQLRSSLSVQDCTLEAGRYEPGKWECGKDHGYVEVYRQPTDAGERLSRILRYDYRPCGTGRRRQSAPLPLRAERKSPRTNVFGCHADRSSGASRASFPYRGFRTPHRNDAVVQGGDDGALSRVLSYKLLNRDSRFLTELGGESERRSACPRFDPGNGWLADAKDLFSFKLRYPALLPPSP